MSFILTRASLPLMQSTNCKNLRSNFQQAQRSRNVHVGEQYTRDWRYANPLNSQRAGTDPKYLDNKGLSSYLFEQAMLTDSTAAPGFVAAFSQSSVGDTTPNVLGAWCDDGSGQMCTLENSTCAGTSENCHGRGKAPLKLYILLLLIPALGPEFQKLDLGVSSCYEIGRRVYAAAKSLYVKNASSDSEV